ncbi:YdbL family probable chaperone protein [Photorhabdus bodei]|uniref:YdbL family protein n=1 Tax=Photorhabdus bodei TaxID=2029681 RepID=UPI001E351FC0|nr:YdbL family protein [Photorhabdus bodei]MCC8463442.1 YdbL family protein [Photorhabdus bodei]
MKRTGTGILLLAGVLFSSSVVGMTLNEAKQKGLVGETFSGYLAIVKTDSQAQALVAEINQAREKKYAEIAAGNNISTKQVAKLTGEKLVNRAEPGEYVLGVNGKWLKK